MSRAAILGVAALVATGSLAATGCCPPGEAGVTVTRRGATLVSVCAGIADTDAARAKGLGGQNALARDEGLLLVFPTNGEACITNAPVAFPIDAVYAADDGSVVAVEPFAAGDAGVRCHRPVRRVLEVEGGVAQAVAPGDLLHAPGG